MFNKCLYIHTLININVKNDLHCVYLQAVFGKLLLAHFTRTLKFYLQTKPVTILLFIFMVTTIDFCILHRRRFANFVYVLTLVIFAVLLLFASALFCFLTCRFMCTFHCSVFIFLLMYWLVDSPLGSIYFLNISYLIIIGLYIWRIIFNSLTTMAFVQVNL